MQLTPVHVPTTSEQPFTLERLSQSDVNYTVIFAYPKASTPGCTTESEDFTRLYTQYQHYKTQIFGLSADSVQRQQNFKTKVGMPFELIADTDEVLCQQLGIIQEKTNFGKTYMGIVRSTFLFDAQGQLVEQWRNVKVKDHAQRVLDYIATR